MPSTSWPPFPGVTPATTFVPYSRFLSVWNDPSRPVIPWTTSRVSAFTTIAIRRRSRRARRRDRPRAVSDDADDAVERGVGHARLAGQPLLGRKRLEVAQLGDVGMADERVVVDRVLRVERP